ncbi:MAG TPA: roadblock/LC7 domain-containing protein [Anaerolineales bacterium]|nr:roadblock/LC7 domain-containing protein [Anaerolineales bacterium]
MYAESRGAQEPARLSRAEALSNALGRLSWPSLDVRWAALVDYDGFLLASYPPEAQFDSDRVAAATAHVLSAGERARQEVQLGKWRFTLMVGAEMQQLVLAINKECVLSIGLGPSAPLAMALDAVRGIIPDLARDLDLASRKYTETNTILWRPGDLKLPK